MLHSPENSLKMSTICTPNAEASSSYVSPRERMRLAKVALIEDEDKEVEVRRERRKSRRASEISMGLEVPRLGSRRSSAVSFASTTSQEMAVGH